MFDTLAMAAHRGNGELVAKLLEEGEDVDEINHSRTALGAASANNFTNIVNTLLKHGATVDVFDGMGMTPLIDSAWRDKTTESVRILLEHSADPNLLKRASPLTNNKSYGQSALWFAASFGRLPAVQLMLCHGADPAAAGPGSAQDWETESICDVIMIPDTEAGAAIRVLVDAVTKSRLTGLEIAIGLGDETTVASLIKLGRFKPADYPAGKLLAAATGSTSWGVTSDSMKALVRTITADTTSSGGLGTIGSVDNSWRAAHVHKPTTKSKLLKKHLNFDVELSTSASTSAAGKTKPKPKPKHKAPVLAAHLVGFNAPGHYKDNAPNRKLGRVGEKKKSAGKQAPIPLHKRKSGWFPDGAPAILPTHLR